ncbi:hypothetical protein SynRS9909_01422 [Synechococcus sp. RS9909]|nr:hypothetical protein SynRS9909_01422 [Synechococcus sp. RS9909]
MEKLWKRSNVRGKGALFKAADRSAPLAQQSRSAAAPGSGSAPCRPVNPGFVGPIAVRHPLVFSIST